MRSDHHSMAGGDKDISELWRMMHFWHRICEEGHSSQDFKAMRLAQLPPLKDDAFGFGRVYRCLWTKGKAKRIVWSMLVLVRVCLNMFVFFYEEKHVFERGEIEFGGGAVALMHGSARLCMPMANSTHIDVHSDCIHTRLSRMTSYRIIAGVESAIFFGVLLLFIICTIRFLCWRVDDSLANALPSKSPAFFAFAPVFAQSFSSMWCLQFININRASSLLLRGELKFWLLLVYWSAFPSKSQPYKSRTEDTDESDGICSYLQRGLFWFSVAILYFSMLIAGFQALLVKLSAVAWAGLGDYTDFGLYQWCAFFGFLNQISGIFTPTMIELQRFLLSLFGGPNAIWSWDEILEVHNFYRILFFRLLDSRIMQKGGHFACLSVFATLSADDLQGLLQSEEDRDFSLQRQSFHQKAMRSLHLTPESKTCISELQDVCTEEDDLRTAWSEVIHDSEGYDKWTEKRDEIETKYKAVLRRRISEAKQIRDGLINLARECDDGDDKEGTNAQGASLIHLQNAMEVQGHIHRLKKVALHQPLKQFLEKHCIEHSDDDSENESFFPHRVLEVVQLEL